MKQQLLSFFIFISFFANAQHWQWAKQTKGKPSGVVYGNSIAIDKYKNSYVTGGFIDTVYFGSIQLVSKGSNDIFIAKYDSLGTVLWAKRAGSPGGDVGSGIALDSLGNAYITGSFSYYMGVAADFDGILLANSGGWDAFAAKYDSNGNAIWARAGTTNPNDERANSIDVDDLGNSYVFGNFGGQSIKFGTITLSSNLLVDTKLFIVKYDKNGNALWAKLIDSGLLGSVLEPHDISVDKQKNVYITGYVQGKGVFGSTIIDGTYSWAGYVAKLDSLQNFVWAQSGFSDGVSLDNDINGNTYLVFEDPSSVNVRKINTSGAVAWSTRIGNALNSNMTNAFAICTDKDKNSYITGIFTGVNIFSTDTISSSGVEDVFVTKCDSAGNVLWGKSAGGSQSDYGYGIGSDNSGNCYVVGNNSSISTSFDTITLSKTNNYTSMFIGKIDTAKIFSAKISISFQPDCSGLCNGTATVNLQYGRPPFTYLWSNGQTTKTASGLCMGTYTVTVKDINGCPKTATVSILPNITLTTSQLNIFPNSGNTGQASVIVNGGTPNYSYSWNTMPIQTTQTATGLSAGTYTVTVTDANSCSNSTTVSLISPSPSVISAGSYHSFNICSNGMLRGWGYNTNYQLGDGSNTQKNEPESIPGMTNNLISCAAGQSSSMVLKNDGTIWSWGSNNEGELGDSTFITRISPVQSPKITGVIDIKPGRWHSLALKNDGTVWAWGYNLHGELGNGLMSHKNYPVKVSGITDVVAISAGDFHSLALKKDGTVWAWGNGSNGELGDGTYNTRSTPVKVNSLTHIIAIAGGSTFSLALKDDGSVWAWGQNSYGQLGDGTIIDEITPIQVHGTGNVGFLSGITKIAAGVNFCVALKNDGTVWGWGINTFGQLGDGTTISKSSPVQSLITNVIALESGNHTLALRSDGKLWAWGVNTSGQLGDGTTISKSNPFQLSCIGINMNITNISCSGDSTGTAIANVAGCDSPYTYSWNSNPVQNTPTATGLAAGTYSVTVSDASGCIATRSATITAPAALSVTVNSVSVCQGQSATLTATSGTGGGIYLWNNGSTSQSITINPSVTTTYTVTYTIGRCSATGTGTVTIKPIPSAPLASSNSPICSGTSLNLSASTIAGVTYKWTGPGAFSSTLQNPARPGVTAAMAGTYSVTVTLNLCTSPVATTLVAVTDASVTVNSVSICSGQSTVLTATPGTGGGTYLWNTGATSQSITVSPISLTNYTVNYSRAGCSASGTSTVNVSNFATLPFSEGFQNVTFVPVNWNLSNPDANVTWTRNTSVGGFGGSNSSAMMNNYSPPNIRGQKDAMLTPSLDLSAAASATLKFDVAYARYNSASVDSLKVYISTDCGNSWVKIYGKGGSSLATAPDIATGVFVPTSSQWRTETISLNSFIGQSKAIFSFENRSDYGQALYVDNINITNTIAAANVSILQTSGSNPVCNGSLATFTATPSYGGTMPVYQWKVNNINVGTNSSVYSTTTLSNNDVVKCIMTSSISGVTNNPATSNSIIINVIPTPAIPTISLSGPTVFCQGDSVTLTSSSSSSNLWTNGSTSQSITVSSSQNDSVKVTSPNGCSAYSSPISITVNPLPTAAIAANGPVTFCQGDSVTLTANNSNSYLWSNGATSQSITVASSQNDSVKITTANGCSATSSSILVTVNPLPSIPSITPNGPTTFCQGDSVFLTASSSNSYLWSNGATLQSTTILSSQNDSVKVTNANGCSATSSSILVTVNPLPILTITANGPTTFCQGDSVTLISSSSSSNLWSNGSTSQSITVSSSQNDSVKVTDANGCSAASSILVTVNPLPTPTITANGSITFCQGDSVTLTSSSSSSYLWSTGATSQSITVSSSQNDSVKVTDANGCFGTSSPTVVTVNTLPLIPTIVASGPITFCQGDSVILTSNNSNSYLWSNGNTTQSIIVSSTENDSVTITDANGCSATSSGITIVENAIPNLVVNDPAIVCSPNTIDISSSPITSGSSNGAFSYWQDSIATVPLILSFYSSVDTSGVYYIKLENSGCSDIKAVTVSIDHDCVWPGDANHNLVVDNYDLLPIGIFYSEIGSPRIVTSDLWQPYSANNWGLTEINGTNIKHADCNGDGIINDNDTLAVNLNFSSIHALRPYIGYSRSTDPGLYFITSSSTYLPGDIVNVDVIAGTSSIPFTNLYGLGFNINYDASLVQSGSESLNYPYSWLGNPNSDAIKFSRIESSSNTAFGAETRIDHINRSGYGKIATFRFQVSPSITTLTTMNFGFSSYSANDSVGNDIPLNNVGYSILIDPSATGVSENLNKNSIAIYPNPYSEYTTISYTLSNRSDVEIEVYNSIGQKVKTIVNSNEPSGDHKYQFSAKEQGYENGIYFVKIIIDGKVTMKKIVEMK